MSIKSWMRIALMRGSVVKRGEATRSWSSSTRIRLPASGGRSGTAATGHKRDAERALTELLSAK